MKRFEAAVLYLLPKEYVFDGEIVVLDEAGRPLFNELMFGRRRLTYVAFDLLEAHGVDLRPLPDLHRNSVMHLTATLIWIASILFEFVGQRTESRSV